MDFTTANMSLEERYDILNKVDLIPIGTICYRADYVTCKAHADYENWLYS